MKSILVLFISILFSFSPSVNGEKNPIPEPFRGASQNAVYTIDFADITALLQATVADSGMSKRTKARKSQSAIGSRIKTNINRLTELEGNRFYFETFETPEQKAIVTKIKNSLENLPNEIPLNQLHTTEQLAFWLNLYNITLIDELIKIYPEKSLEDYVDDSKKSILNKKLLFVAGIHLSLNDIHHKILMPKYKNDPRIMYGLYQGIIGGPNIRRTAFTGDNVYKSLQDNAYEFVNSNRGTYFDRKKVFRVSSYYKRNEDYFPNFKADLISHLNKYLLGDMRYNLEQAKKIRTNINSWNIADLYGTTRRSGSSAATNEAALMDSMGNSDNGLFSGIDGMTGISAVFTQGPMSGTLSNLSINYGRFTPEQARKLKALNEQRVINPGRVDITDLDSEQDK